MVCELYLNKKKSEKKKGRVVILTSDTIDFGAKKSTEDNEGQYIMIKGH